MPVNVVKTAKDEKMWERKKKQVAKQKGKSTDNFTDTDWRLVNFLFQKAKKKYRGRKLPKKYAETASFKDKVEASYAIVALKPIEHFDNSIHPFWSIQTERTHGKKGVIHVSKSQLEDPALSMKAGDHQRMAGAEDIFQGSKEALLAYIKQSYKDFKTIEFRKA